MNMAKNAASNRAVLRKVGSKAGRRNLRSVNQLLTSAERGELRDDLVEMARQRRVAEASSSSLRLS